MSKNKVGLALEGGGAKGSYQIGAYNALKKLGYKFDMVVGTSIGSLNAAMIVQGDIELAKEIWFNADSEIVGLDTKLVENIKDGKIDLEEIKYSFNEIKNILKNKGLDITNYKNTIDKYVNEEKVRKSSMNYGLVTVRIKDLKPFEVTIDEIEYGKLNEYILGSSYLPIFKKSKIIDNSFYIDGAVSNNLPITLLEKHGCNKIFAIKIDGIGTIKKYKKDNITILEPTKDTGPIVLFDNNDIKNNYYMGYYDTLLYFNKLDGFKYYFKKYFLYNFKARKVNKSILDLMKLKYKVDTKKDCILKAIEEVLEYNKVDYYQVYSVGKMIKYIKNNKLSTKSMLINEFIYELK